MTDPTTVATDPTTVELHTVDGVRLIASHFPAGDRRIGCVVAHGFTGSATNAAVRRICTSLAGHGFGVLAPDLRGHGRSGGVGTAGLTEVHDVAAAVAELRAQGYAFVVVLGWSMGGTATLRHAGAGGDADAVVAVSAPGLWFERGTRAMRLVHWMVGTRSGRLATRVLRRTRVSDAGWDDPPPAPAEVVAGIAPRPLLLVHGDADRYFPSRHVDALAAAAPGAVVWREAGMGHAEVATTTDLLARIGRWIEAAAAAGAVCNDGGRD